MEKSQKRLLITIKFGVFVIYSTLIGFVYWMGITSPNFQNLFNQIYRGVGYGLIYPLFFLIIPTYAKKMFPDVRFSGPIASIVSCVLSIILLFIIFPLQT